MLRGCLGNYPVDGSQIVATQMDEAQAEHAVGREQRRREVVFHQPIGGNLIAALIRENGEQNGSRIWIGPVTQELDRFVDTAFGDRQTGPREFIRLRS